MRQDGLQGRQDNHCKNNRGVRQLLPSAIKTAKIRQTLFGQILFEWYYMTIYICCTNLSAGISARRPEISRRASAHRDVESAIIDTL